MADDKKKRDDIDYTAEGKTPPQEKQDKTNAGYDEAAHSGHDEGALGTHGGGTYSGGMHEEK